MMKSKFLQVAVVAAGATFVLGSVAACADDSTAIAPITSDPVTTTSMYSAEVESTVTEQHPEAEHTEQSPNPGNGAEGTGNGGAPEGRTTEGGGGAGNAAPPENFEGPGGQELSENAQRYLATLTRENVEFMGDTDNNIALTMAEYICAENSKGTDPVTMKAYVTASVGPGTESVAEANEKADKVINAAKSDYC